jgi:predicted enzyme related to lactoylglutathione lyase
MVAAGVLLALGGPLAQAQAPSSATQPGESQKALVIDTGALTPFVENMDRSLAFYHDVFDMEVPPLPATGGPRPYNNPNPRLFAFFDIPGAKERHQSARVQGVRTGLEAMEIQQVPFKTVNLRIQDPGNVTIVLWVRDIDTTLARVKKAGYPVVSTGGATVTLDDGTRAVIVRDVDNRFLELRQPAVIPATAPPHNVIDVSAMVTVADLPRTTQVYRDVFGFTIDGEKKSFPPDKPTRLLAKDASSAGRARRARPAAVAGVRRVKGVDRTPLSMKIRTAARALQFRAQNIDGVVDAPSAGSRSPPGGAATPIPPNFKGALIVDPTTSSCRCSSRATAAPAIAPPAGVPR